ncbi:DUF397 domain-containing protein [Actinomadura kijaniata]|uniref:DUF397 domain-containing protein n=1 Tax=Actinomadura kijaniata TaxID=46161 RepID=UPI003F1DDF5F
MDLSNAKWRRASHSSDKADNCIEVAATLGIVAIRDSKDPDGGMIVLNREEAHALSVATKNAPRHV